MEVADFVLCRGLKTELLFLLLILLSVRAPLCADETATESEAAATQEIRVLAAVVPEENQEASAFSRVIADSLRLLSRRKNLSIEVPSDGMETKNFMSDHDFTALLNRRDSDFGLLARYRIQDEKMEIHFSWFEPDQVRKPRTVSLDAVIDLELDEHIREGLQTLLDEVGPRIKEAAAARRQKVEAEITADELEAEVDQTAEKSAPLSGGETYNADSDDAAGLPNQTKPAESKETSGSPKPQPEEIEPQSGAEDTAAENSYDSGTDAKFFCISAGFAPFVATGAAANYFKTGLQPIFNARFLIHLDAAYLGIGIFSALNTFIAEGSLGSARTYLIPAGLHIRYETDYDFPLGLFIHLSGGPAVFMLEESDQMFTKLIPFAAAGLGISIEFAPSFRLVLDAAYEVFFEFPHLIMGFSPSLSTEFRL
jgi:hypothetical protein